MNNDEDTTRIFFGRRNLMNAISSDHYTQLPVSHAGKRRTKGDPVDLCPWLVSDTGV